MSISFVWLCMFKCDVCMLNYLMIKPKKIFEYFICFWKWFLSLCFWMFFSKCQILCVEKLCLAISRLLSQMVPSHKILKEFQFLKNFRQRVSWLPCKWFATQTWPMKFCPVHLHISRVGSWLVCESLTRKIQKKKIFKGLENSVFKILVFLHSTTPTLQNSKFLPKLIKTLLISTLRLLQGIFHHF